MTRPPALLGADAPPAVRVGSRVRCLYRGAACEVTSFADAPLGSPRVLPGPAGFVLAVGPCPGGSRRG